MNWKQIAWVATVIASAGAGLWTGSELQKAAYLDRCLDLGGGRNPGDHPICVIEMATAPLQLGPIAITAQEVVGGETRDYLDHQAIAELRLAPEVAAALTAFTNASVGRTLDIRVDGSVVRSVNIAESVKGDRFILIFSRANAQFLAQSLGLDDL